MRKESFISRKNRSFCGKRKKKRVKIDQTVFRIPGMPSYHRGKWWGDPKTPCCLKISNSSDRIHIPIVLDNLTRFRFYLGWPFTHSLAHSWIYSAWDPSRQTDVGSWDLGRRACGEEGRQSKIRAPTARGARPEDTDDSGARLKSRMSSGREWLTQPEVALHREECLVVFCDLWNAGSLQCRLTILLCSAAPPRLDFSS